MSGGQVSFNVMCVSVGWGHCVSKIVLECVALVLDAGVIVSLCLCLCAQTAGVGLCL